MPHRRRFGLVVCLFGNAALMLAIVADYLFHASAWQTPLLWTYLGYMVGLWGMVLPWWRARDWLRRAFTRRASTLDDQASD